MRPKKPSPPCPEFSLDTFRSSRKRILPVALFPLVLFSLAELHAAEKSVKASTEASPKEASHLLSDWCQNISKRLASVPAALCRDMGLKASGAYSVRGQPLMIRDVPPGPLKEFPIGKERSRRPIRVLLIGGIHGDELSSASIVFRWMQWLNEPEAGSRHWHIVPVANPDGLLASPPQRANARGVDLNRNFPTPDWATAALHHWNGKALRDPRRFPGNEALSEPETRWLYDEMENFKPDVIVATHAPYGVLDYDGPARQPRRFGSLWLNRQGVYPGSLGNFGGVFKGVPVVTIELPSATAMPSGNEQRKIWDDMQAWISRHISPQNLRVPGKLVIQEVGAKLN